VSQYVHHENSNPKSSLQKEKILLLSELLEVCFEKISVDPVLSNVKREQSVVFKM
jgi:hypothetical protein